MKLLLPQRDTLFHELTTTTMEADKELLSTPLLQDTTTSGSDDTVDAISFKVLHLPLEHIQEKSAAANFFINL